MAELTEQECEFLGRVKYARCEREVCDFCKRKEKDFPECLLLVARREARAEVANLVLDQLKKKGYPEEDGFEFFFNGAEWQSFLQSLEQESK